MKAKEALDIARQWVDEHGSKMAGFSGAYLTGSVLWLSEDDIVPPTSDVDMRLIFSVQPTEWSFKISYRNVVLDVACESLEENLDPDVKARSGSSVGHFCKNNIISDPTGALAAIRDVVRATYIPQRAVLGCRRFPRISAYRPHAVGL